MILIVHPMAAVGDDLLARTIGDGIDKGTILLSRPMTPPLAIEPPQIKVFADAGRTRATHGMPPSHGQIGTIPVKTRGK